MELAATLRVLILDDNRDNADSLGALVRLWGYEPVIAYGGQSALELASIHEPQVVLLDLALPHLSGLEVARRLRQRREMDRTAIIAITGYADEQTRRQTLACGIEAFLIKPVDPAVLERLLADIAAQTLVKTLPLAKKTRKLPTVKKAEVRSKGGCG